MWKIRFFKRLGPGRPLAGWALMDRWEGKVLTGKLLAPRLAPAALSLEECKYVTHSIHFLAVFMFPGVYWQVPGSFSCDGKPLPTACQIGAMEKCYQHGAPNDLSDV